uniref:Uncharacterized protein n=1 Tax=Arundo donax TaxID=35708 RepID=A0A0A9ESG4_ARUDO
MPCWPLGHPFSVGMNWYALFPRWHQRTLNQILYEHAFLLSCLPSLGGSSSFPVIHNADSEKQRFPHQENLLFSY